MKRKKSLTTMIIGHTHIREWRRFPDGKLYLNSGTWNIIPSFDVGQHSDEKRLTYLYLTVNEANNELMEASINSWQGEWKPFTSDGCLTSIL
jgi:predicted phosphodiesterase